MIGMQAGSDGRPRAMGIEEGRGEGLGYVGGRVGLRMQWFGRPPRSGAVSQSDKRQVAQGVNCERPGS